VGRLSPGSGGAFANLEYENNSREKNNENQFMCSLQYSTDNKKKQGVPWGETGRNERGGRSVLTRLEGGGSAGVRFSQTKCKRGGRTRTSTRIGKT